MFKVLRHIVRITALVAIMIMVGPSSAVQVDAASSIGIDGPSSVAAGDEFTVTVTFNGDNIGRVEAQLTYDDDVISYISGGSSKGDSGYVQLNDAGTGEVIKFNLKFKAVDGGTSPLDVNASAIYSLDEEYLDAPSASASVKVEAAEETEETTIEETSSVTASPVSPETLEDPQEKAGFFSKPFVMLFAIAGGVILIMLIFALAVSKSNKKGKHTRRR